MRMENQLEETYISLSGWNLFHSTPKIIGTDIQNEDTASTDIILNPLTKSIGAPISSGFEGITTNIAPINMPYPITEMSFFFP